MVILMKIFLWDRWIQAIFEGIDSMTQTSTFKWSHSHDRGKMNELRRKWFPDDKKDTVDFW